MLFILFILLANYSKYYLESGESYEYEAGGPVMSPTIQ